MSHEPDYDDDAYLAPLRPPENALRVNGFVHGHDEILDWARNNDVEIRTNPETGGDQLVMNEDQRFWFKMRFDV